VTFLLPRFSELFAGHLTQTIAQSLCIVFKHTTTEAPHLIKDAAVQQGLSPDLHYTVLCSVGHLCVQAVLSALPCAGLGAARGFMNAQRLGVVASSCRVNQTRGVARLLSSLLLLLLLHLEVHGRSGRNMKLWKLGEFNLI